MAGRSAIIPVERGAKLVRPCNSLGPTGIESFFTPKASKIASLEKAVAKMLLKNEKKYLPLAERLHSPSLAFQWPRDPTTHARQYIGYVADKRRMIYGVFTPSSAVEKTIERRGQQWFLERPLILCDAGASLFSVEYDIEDNEVDVILFSNGWGRGLPAIVPKRK